MFAKGDITKYIYQSASGGKNLLKPALLTSQVTSDSCITTMSEGKQDVALAPSKDTEKPVCRCILL